MAPFVRLAPFVRFSSSLAIETDGQLTSLYCACIIFNVSTIQDINRILRIAELSLQKLLEQAVAEQRYSDVATVAAIADTIAKMLRRGGILEAETPAISRIVRDVAPLVAHKKAKTGYPRFLRDGDKLVKIGWSKNAKEEYEHRAPLEVADALLASIRAKVQDGQKFAATDVIPVRLAEESVPDYQAYQTLKWLHSEGVVTKHGRDQYAVELGRIGPEGLKPIWSRLPT